MCYKKNAGKLLSLFLLPVAYGFLAHFLFDLQQFNNFFTVISVSFLFLVPLSIGALSAFLFRATAWRRGWLPVAIFAIILAYFTLAYITKKDHFICLSIAFFPFLFLTLITGILFSILKLGNKLILSVILFLPFIICPVEKLAGATEQVFETESNILLTGSRDSLWKNVMGFRAEMDLSVKQGFPEELLPKPVEAVFISGAIGEERKAIFSNGIIFRESITSIEYGKEMNLSIQTDPSLIPPEALDKHLVMGGYAFDLVSGRYVLTETTPGNFNLSLSCKYRLRTNINFYASFWASFIIKEIQMSILAAVKERSKSI